MDFEDTPEEAAFRAEARTWLDANAKRKTPDSEPARDMMASRDDPESIRESQAWQAKLYDGGWGGITWPKEYGGQGRTAIQSIIFNQELSQFEVPASIFGIGIGMAGPTLMVHATDAQKERYLQPMLRGDEVWCQLFSEPSAGSDLANVSTQAVRDGDEWIINGQKVWTSGAHYSKWGILVTRSDPEKPKHRGISYFIVDMESAGIEIRPLKQITGASHFNEVFFTDVRVPHENLVGEINGGWAVAITTLMNERMSIGGGGMRGGMGFHDLVEMAQSLEKTGERVVRQQLADIYIRTQVLKYLGYRSQSALSQGRAPGPEGSVSKLGYAELLKRQGSLALALQGPAGALASTDARDDGAWQTSFLGAPAIRIAGGTDEVQRNITGDRVLGLPREPRVDKEISYKESSVLAQ